jgi:lipopolysaccharide transport system ATP-binding protein
MSETIITVEKLSKRYTIQHRTNRNEGFRHVLEEKVTAPFRRLFGRNGSEGDSAKRESSEEFWALKDVSFEIRRGDVIGIIGRNGAGKSTLLKILSRITEPTEGRVRLRGRVASLLEVGTGFHPELTGRENIFLNGAILGMSKAEIKRKFDEIVAFSEVENFLDTPVKRYSSGMYVRLAFAVAAHLEPEILIVDEVLAVGDAEFQKKCLGKMESVSRNEGRTVLFVSHNLQAIRNLCNRSLVMAGGKVKFDGPATIGVDTYLEQAGQFDAWSYETAAIARRIHGSGLARIEKVWFTAQSTRIKFGGRFQVRVQLSATENLSDVCFDLTFFSMDNNPVGTSFSIQGIAARQGRSTYELTIPVLRIAPGKYCCDIALLKGNWLRAPSLHDVVEKILHFEMEFPEAQNGNNPVWLQGWGSSVPEDIDVLEIAG